MSYYLDENPDNSDFEDRFLIHLVDGSIYVIDTYEGITLKQKIRLKTKKIRYRLARICGCVNGK